MTGNVYLVGAAAALLVVGAAVVTGVGPAPGGNGGEEIENFPTQTPSSSTPSDHGEDDGDEAASTSGTVTPTDDGPPFVLTVDDIEDCGETCRDVTTTLTNEQSTDAENVTVYTRMFVGNGTDGDVVWQKTESVGTLGADESMTVTNTVELSLSDGYSVKQNDGLITVQTTIQSDEETMTVTKQRDVI